MRPSLFARKPFKYQQLLDQTPMGATSVAAVLEAPTPTVASVEMESDAPVYKPQTRVRTLDLKAVLAARRAAEESAHEAADRSRGQTIPVPARMVSLMTAPAPVNPAAEQQRHQAMRTLASARLQASANPGHRPKLLDALLQMIRLRKTDPDQARVAALRQEAQRLERQLT